MHNGHVGIGAIASVQRCVLESATHPIVNTPQPVGLAMEVQSQDHQAPQRASQRREPWRQATLYLMNPLDPSERLFHVISWGISTTCHLLDVDRNREAGPLLGASQRFESNVK